ncbi:DUF2442 domain-containing protein [Rhizobium sp. C1]|uniref:DUF2442 domain-containing protein n=1 Tax=Rhizobium sp. C1 TaxID=1349799 RepID=UPI001E32A897|nr:DUF2442 domain-containing protein [Rhizobium sp. C1]MCD2176557.1 DUF2442 domain-containing protein [Rhizobium sp. C1]
MRKLLKVTARPDYQLEVVFDDGLSGVIALKDRLFGPMFEPLRDPAFFERVEIDAFGALLWPNGADLDPDALYKNLTADRTRGSVERVL